MTGDSNCVKLSGKIRATKNQDFIYDKMFNTCMLVLTLVLKIKIEIETLLIIKESIAQ